MIDEKPKSVLNSYIYELFIQHVSLRSEQLNKLFFKWQQHNSLISKLFLSTQAVLLFSAGTLFSKNNVAALWTLLAFFVNIPVFYFFKNFFMNKMLIIKSEKLFKQAPLFFPPPHAMLLENKILPKQVLNLAQKCTPLHQILLLNYILYTFSICTFTTSSNKNTKLIHNKEQWNTLNQWSALNQWNTLHKAFSEAFSKAFIFDKPSNDYWDYVLNDSMEWAFSAYDIEQLRISILELFSTTATKYEALVIERAIEQPEITQIEQPKNNKSAKRL